MRFLSTPSARRATLGGGQFGVDLIISIHALREEGDGHGVLIPMFFNGFLSTPSARRATGKDGSIGLSVDISIHALREEGDLRH